MNPLALRLRNHRTFEELDLDLPTGCVAIVGANGAGKSTLVNAIDLALFGPDGASWSPYLKRGGDADELMVELMFEHAGETYRVRRGYSARGRGKTTLDLELHHDASSFEGAREFDESWEPLTAGATKDTQERIVQLLGMSRATLRASSLLLQGDGGAFTEVGAAARMGVLTEILGLDRYKTLADRVKRDRRTAEDERVRITASLEAADTALADRPLLEARLRAAATILTEATTAITVAETRAAELAEQARVHSVAAAQLHAARVERDRAADTLRALDVRKADAVTAREQLAIATDELAALPTSAQLDQLEREEHDLRAKVEEFNAAGAARAAAERERAALEAQQSAILSNAKKMIEEAAQNVMRAGALETAGPGVDHCDQCGQTLGAEALASTVAALRTHADELRAAATDLERQAAAILLPEIPAATAGEPPVQELAQVAQRLRAAREAAVQGARLAERMTALGVTIGNGSGDAFDTERANATAAVEKLQANVDALTAAAPTAEILDRVEREAQLAAIAMRDQRARASSATAEKAKAEQQLERLDELDRQSAEARARRNVLDATVDELAMLERAYGRDGIPALIVENAAIPQIEAEANRILARMPTADGDVYRVELRTQRALKSSDAVRDTLDIVICAPDGECEYAFFSGGEQTRINLALRLALAQLLAARRSADSRLVVIDEPDGLDRGGKDALIEILRELEAGGMERLYLISHDADLRESLDSAIEVVKENRTSRIVEAAVLEGAAA